jgi:hypothetical protein
MFSYHDLNERHKMLKVVGKLCSATISFCTMICSIETGERERERERSAAEANS